MFSYRPHRLLEVGAAQSNRPDQFGRIARTDQIYLGLTIAKDMYMRRFMVIGEDNEA